MKKLKCFFVFALFVIFMTGCGGVVDSQQEINDDGTNDSTSLKKVTETSTLEVSEPVIAPASGGTVFTSLDTEMIHLSAAVGDDIYFCLSADLEAEAVEYKKTGGAVYVADLIDALPESATTITFKISTYALRDGIKSPINATTCSFVFKTEYNELPAAPVIIPLNPDTNGFAATVEIKAEDTAAIFYKLKTIYAEKEYEKYTSPIYTQMYCPIGGLDYDYDIVISAYAENEYGKSEVVTYTTHYSYHAPTLSTPIILNPKEKYEVGDVITLGFGSGADTGFIGYTLDGSDPEAWRNHDSSGSVTITLTNAGVFTLKTVAWYYMNHDSPIATYQIIVAEGLVQ